MKEINHGPSRLIRERRKRERQLEHLHKIEAKRLKRHKSSRRESHQKGQIISFTQKIHFPLTKPNFSLF